MPRLSTLSNPTSLIEIDKKRVGIRVEDSGGTISVSLFRLDLAGVHLPEDLNVVVIASRGNTEERLDFGALSTWNRSAIDLVDIAAEGAWSFRVLLVQPGNPKIVALSEGLRPDGEGGSESFIALEPADLDQRPWEISILGPDGRVVISFNRLVYRSSGEAIADEFFICMILPEAVRRLAEWFVREEECSLQDPQWEPFRDWLRSYGVSDDPQMEDEVQKEEWCREVVNSFCRQFGFAEILAVRRNGGSEE